MSERTPAGQGGALPAAAPAKAFTLIEVLVVVAIIALLVSILLPSLSRARELARITACKTRMMQVHRAHVFYASDNRGVFPHWSWWLYDAAGHDDGKPNFFSPGQIYSKTGGVRSEDSRRWPEYGDTMRYLRDREAYFCPSDSKARARGTGSIGSGGGNGEYAIHSYVRIIDPHQFIQNGIDGGQVNGAGSSARLQPGDFINPEKLRAGVFRWPNNMVPSGFPDVRKFFSVPSRVGFLYEEDQGIGGDNVPKNSSTLNDGHSSVVTYSDYMSARHQKRAHLAYFDGHVELLDAVRWNNYKAGNVSDPYIFYKALGGGTPPVVKPRQ